MSGAWLAALLLQTAPAPDAAPLALAPAHPRVGDRVVVTAALPATPGQRIRFARPPEVDAAFARVEPLLAEATSRSAASLRVEMVAAAAGTFRIGPFSLTTGASNSDAAGDASEFETGSVDVEVAAAWPDGKAPGFDEWRGPVAAAPSTSIHGWRWLIAAAGAVALAAAWVALRRRGARAPRADAAPPPVVARAWRDELSRLAANIPETLSARRIWWSDLSRIVRDELARHSRDDSPDRTTEELAAVADAAPSNEIRGEIVALLLAADAGKFAPASAAIAAASSAVTSALRLLDEVTRTRADPS